MPLHGWERRGFLLFAASIAATLPLAVWLAVPLRAGAPSAPQEATAGNSVAIVAGVAAFVLLSAGISALIIWAARTGRDRIIQLSVAAAIAIVLTVPLLRAIVWLGASVGDTVAWSVGLALSIAVVAAWWRNRSWWADNLITLLLGATLAAVLGSVLGVLPLLPLLAAMAAFDAWAVLRTGKMVHLAHASRRMGLPTMLASGPATGPVRRVEAEAAPTGSDAASVRRFRRQPRTAGVLLMGLGDVVFPAMLVVAAADPTRTWGPWPAVGTAVGTLLGYTLLVRMSAGRHALPGLPVLNGGAIAGFLVGLLASTGSLRFWT